MTGTLTLAPYVAAHLGERRRRGEITFRTFQHRGYHLRGLVESFGARPVESFGPAAVLRWQETIGHLSAGTRRNQLSTVRVFGRWLVARKVIKRDPTAGLPYVKQPRKAARALPEDAAARILGAAPDARGRAIVWLMLGCGLRCCEVAHLEVADYDPTGRTLFVRGKGGHERVLPVPDAVAHALDAYIVEAGSAYGPLIRSVRASRASCGLLPGSISNLLSIWVADAGVKVRPRDGVSAHALRHTAASDVLERCHDLRVVQQMLGHVHLSTTAIYLRQAAMGDMRTAMEGRAYRIAG